MTTEQWNYIATNWSSPDELVQEEIAKIKAQDEAEQAEAKKKIEERDAKIQELTQQNVALNNTNLSMSLRLIKPNGTVDDIVTPEPEPYKPPKVTDYDSFVK